jgi:CRP-like cAMP-binding protein
MNELFQFLHSINSLSDELQQHLRGILRFKELPKKGYLLKAGHVCRNIYFIQKGLLRCFYIKEGKKEVCAWFMKEGDVIASVASFFNQKVSYESIQALEDCQIYTIDHAQLEHIYKQYPEFNYVGRVLVQNYYKLSEQRLFSMRMQTASERYDYLANHFPEIIQRVSTTDIASYLGISRETLSRIKKGRKNNYVTNVKSVVQ